MLNDFAARVAISRFQRSETKYAFYLRALPWAITFRALGARDSSFQQALKPGANNSLCDITKFPSHPNLSTQPRAAGEMTHACICGLA